MMSNSWTSNRSNKYRVKLKLNKSKRKSSSEESEIACNASPQTFCNSSDDTIGEDPFGRGNRFDLFGSPKFQQSIASSNGSYSTKSVPKLSGRFLESPSSCISDDEGAGISRKVSTSKNKGARKNMGPMKTVSDSPNSSVASATKSVGENKSELGSKHTSTSTNLFSRFKALSEVSKSSHANHQILKGHSSSDKANDSQQTCRDSVAKSTIHGFKGDSSHPQPNTDSEFESDIIPVYYPLDESSTAAASGINDSFCLQCSSKNSNKCLVHPLKSYPTSLAMPFISLVDDSSSDDEFTTLSHINKKVRPTPSQPGNRIESDYLSSPVIDISSSSNSDQEMTIISDEEVGETVPVSVANNSEPVSSDSDSITPFSELLVKNKLKLSDEIPQSPSVVNSDLCHEDSTFSSDDLFSAEEDNAPECNKISSSPSVNHNISSSRDESTIIHTKPCTVVMADIIKHCPSPTTDVYLQSALQNLCPSSSLSLNNESHATMPFDDYVIVKEESEETSPMPETPETSSIIPVIFESTCKGEVEEYTTLLPVKVIGRVEFCSNQISTTGAEQETRANCSDTDSSRELLDSNVNKCAHILNTHTTTDTSDIFAKDPQMLDMNAPSDQALGQNSTVSPQDVESPPEPSEETADALSGGFEYSQAEDIVVIEDDDESDEDVYGNLTQCSFNLKQEPESSDDEMEKTPKDILHLLLESDDDFENDDVDNSAPFSVHIENIPGDVSAPGTKTPSSVSKDDGIQSCTVKVEQKKSARLVDDCDMDNNLVVKNVSHVVRPRDLDSKITGLENVDKQNLSACIMDRGVPLKNTTTVLDTVVSPVKSASDEVNFLSSCDESVWEDLPDINAELDEAERTYIESHSATQQPSDEDTLSASLELYISNKVPIEECDHLCDTLKQTSTPDRNIMDTKSSFLAKDLSDTDDFMIDCDPVPAVAESLPRSKIKADLKPLSMNIFDKFKLPSDSSRESGDDNSDSSHSNFFKFVSSRNFYKKNAPLFVADKPKSKSWFEKPDSPEKVRSINFSRQTTAAEVTTAQTNKIKTLMNYRVGGKSRHRSSGPSLCSSQAIATAKSQLKQRRKLIEAAREKSSKVDAKISGDKLKSMSLQKSKDRMHKKRHRKHLDNSTSSDRSGYCGDLPEVGRSSNIEALDSLVSSSTADKPEKTPHKFTSFSNKSPRKNISPWDPKKKYNRLVASPNQWRPTASLTPSPMPSPRKRKIRSSNIDGPTSSDVIDKISHKKRRAEVSEKQLDKLVVDISSTDSNRKVSREQKKSKRSDLASEPSTLTDLGPNSSNLLPKPSKKGGELDIMKMVLDKPPPVAEEVNNAENEQPGTNCIQDPSSVHKEMAGRPGIPPRAERECPQDAFLSCVLAWSVRWLKEQEGQKNPPPVLGQERVIPLLESYNSYHDYVEILRPHILLETWEQMSRQWTESRGHLPLHKLFLCSANIKSGPNGAKCRFLDLSCCKVIKNSERFRINETDLAIVTLRIKSPDGVITTKDVFGFVHTTSRLDSNQTNLHKKLEQELKEQSAYGLQVVLRLLGRKEHLDNSDFMEVRVLTSLMTTMRQYQALLYLEKSCLRNDILRPATSQAFLCHVPVISEALKKEFNGSQATVIASVTAAVLSSSKRPQICLLQGPPGTGKSHTVTGLVKNILLEGCNLNQKPHILVCAPSNGGIDELVRRLVKCYVKRKGGMQLIDVVRCGVSDSLASDVRKYSLDHLTNMRAERFLEQKMVENCVSSVATALEDLRNKLATFNVHLDNARMLNDSTNITHYTSAIDKLQKKKSQILGFKQRETLSTRRRRELQTEVLQKCDVVCTTLSSSGCLRLSQLIANFSRNPPFTAVIIDEPARKLDYVIAAASDENLTRYCENAHQACQAIELDALVPLQYGMSKMVLVGDPEQLPPTVLSQKAMHMNFNQSLFERFFNHFHGLPSNPVQMLSVQYRMHPNICDFPSKHIYQGKLTTDRHVAVERNKCLFAPYTVFDVEYGEESKESDGKLCNPSEARLTMELVKYILQTFKGMQQCHIGVITPYQCQRALIQKYLGAKRYHDIEVGTVDGFQGREKDVIIFTCVRTNNNIGFLKDRRRLNVSLTRARVGLYVLGYLKALQNNSDWRSLIENAHKRRRIVNIPSENKVHDALRYGITRHTNQVADPIRDKEKICDSSKNDHQNQAHGVNKGARSDGRAVRQEGDCSSTKRDAEKHCSNAPKVSADQRNVEDSKRNTMNHDPRTKPLGFYVGRDNDRQSPRGKNQEPKNTERGMDIGAKTDGNTGRHSKETNHRSTRRDAEKPSSKVSADQNNVEDSKRNTMNHDPRTKPLGFYVGRDNDRQSPRGKDQEPKNTERGMDIGAKTDGNTGRHSKETNHRSERRETGKQHSSSRDRVVDRREDHRRHDRSYGSGFLSDPRRLTKRVEPFINTRHKQS